MVSVFIEFNSIYKTWLAIFAVKILRTVHYEVLPTYHKDNFGLSWIPKGPNFLFIHWEYALWFLQKQDTVVAVYETILYTQCANL